MADGKDDLRQDNARTAAPTGMDLHPKDTRAVKLKKSVGLAAAFAVGLVVLLIVWAIATRKGAQVTRNQGGGPKAIRSASQVGQAESDALAKQAADERRAALGDAGAELPSGPAGGVVPRGGQGTSSSARTAPQTSGTGDVADNLDLPPTRVTRSGVQVRETGAQYNGGAPQKSARQLAYEAAEREEMEARNAPLTGRGGGASSILGGGGGLGGATTPTSALADAIRTSGLLNGAGAGSGAGPSVGLGGAGDLPAQDDQNKQNEKQTFLDRARSRPEDVYLKSTRTAPISPFEIKAGWDIPATLDQSVNSDLPGEVRGLVKENVYDSVTGRYLLIPQGSRVIGSYNHRIAYGQNGIQVVWNRLIFPDGSSIQLGAMNGEDARGQSGFRDKVDNHYKRLIGFALLTSAFTAGIELSQNQSTNSFGYPSNSQVVTQALGQQLGELGITITNRNLNIQPTIKIPVGYRFNIRVNKDIAFDGPYRPT